MWDISNATGNTSPITRIYQTICENYINGPVSVRPSICRASNSIITAVIWLLTHSALYHPDPIRTRMLPMTETVCPAHSAYPWPRTSTGSNLKALQAGQKPKKFPATANQESGPPDPPANSMATQSPRASRIAKCRSEPVCTERLTGLIVIYCSRLHHNGRIESSNHGRSGCRPA